MSENALQIIRTTLDTPAFRNQIATALPPQVKPEKFVRVALTAIRQAPDLLKCDRTSLFGSIVTAAQLGLNLETALGTGYLVPFRNRATLVVGYRGLLELVRRSGQLISIEVDVIYATDRVEWILGDESKLTIDRDWQMPPGEIVGAYAIAKLKGGGIQRMVMTKAQIEAIRKKSPSANSPAWRDAWEEMAKKTVLRRLCKLLPMSAEAQNAIAVDEAAERGASARIIEGDVEVIEPEEEGNGSDQTAGDQLAKRGRPKKVEGATKAAALDKLAKPSEAAVDVDPETGEVTGWPDEDGTGTED